MLPEEQLVNSLLYKRAGILDLYSQQSNLGGSAFADSDDPLTSLLGRKFNAKYRHEYADTLHSSLFDPRIKLTSRTGARLLNDINEMNDRGVEALNGLISNKDIALAWIKDINNSRVGVRGYTQESADKDFKDIEDKLNLAAKLRGKSDSAMFNSLAKKYVKGKLTSTIDALKGAMNDVPAVARPFVTDIRSEFTDKTKKIDESQFSGKKDKNEADNKANFFSSLIGNAKWSLKNIANQFSGAGKYLLPALLLGAAGGGINKLRGGSFMGPLLLMALLGGAYGVGRNRGWFGNSNNRYNSTIDTYADSVNSFFSRQQKPTYSAYPTTPTELQQQNMFKY